MIVYSRCKFITHSFSLILLVFFYTPATYATNASFFPSTCSKNSRPISRGTLASKEFWTGLWGVAAPEPRLTLGMWSVHATDKARNGKNDMLGITYKGIGFGTFVNSYWKRAYALTLQRYWAMGPFYKDINYEIGYRLGLVTGYKGFNIIGAEALRNAPFIPFVQLIGGFNWKYFGWEISSPDPYVISTSFYIRFC